MLRILGSHRRACDALSRRDMIQAGGASVLGLGLADLVGQEPDPSLFGLQLEHVLKRLG